MTFEDDRTDEIMIQPFDSDSSKLLGAFAVYRSYTEKEEAAFIGYVRKYSAKENFVGLVANVNQIVAGMCFGAKVTVGNWWFDAVLRQLPSERDALLKAWTLNELGVLPDYKRKGIGTRLLQDLKHRIQSSRVILSTGKENTVARRFYETLGWQELGVVRLSENSKPSAIYSMDWRERENSNQTLDSTPASAAVSAF